MATKTKHVAAIGEDLFGETINRDVLMRERFIEPPFSILDTKGGAWQARKKKWRALGIESHLGREGVVVINNSFDGAKYGRDAMPEVSIFDPALCEVIYNWFCPLGGRILDPFAGGSVRGIVAAYLGFKYTGIDIRPEQVESNREQAREILPINQQPLWYVGDSNVVLDTLPAAYFDMVFTCPPYADLEVYSDLPGDISNMAYPEFLTAYESIIAKSCSKLKPGGFACFVVGEVRDKNGNYIGFVPDTIRAFQRAGMAYYNEAILLNAVASASMRAAGNMKSQKLVKIHQNVLVFKKNA